MAAQRRDVLSVCAKLHAINQDVCPESSLGIPCGTLCDLKKHLLVDTRMDGWRMDWNAQQLQTRVLQETYWRHDCSCGTQHNKIPKGQCPFACTFVWMREEDDPNKLPVWPSKHPTTPKYPPGFEPEGGDCDKLTLTPTPKSDPEKKKKKSPIEDCGKDLTSVLVSELMNDAIQRSTLHGDDSTLGRAARKRIRKKKNAFMSAIIQEKRRYDRARDIRSQVYRRRFVAALGNVNLDDL